MVDHRHASIFGGSSPLTSPSQATNLTPLSPPLPQMPQKPAAMSNIEWIMANAKRQVDAEEEKEEEATLKTGTSAFAGTVKRRRTEQYELSDSETDDLPALDIDSMIKKKTAAGKRATASPIALLSPDQSSASLSPIVVDDDTDEPGGRSDVGDMLSPSEPSVELPLSLIAGRSRRSTARKEPYSFKLSTRRPSGAKKDIFDPKHSAAVKAKIVDVDELKSKRRQNRSAQVSLSKFFNQINRENRDGLGPDAINEALRLIKQTSSSLDDDLNDFEDDTDSEEDLHSLSRSKDGIFSTLVVPRIAGEQSGSDSEEEDKERNGTQMHTKHDGIGGSHSGDLETIKAAMEREIKADGDEESEQRSIAMQVLIQDHAKALGHEKVMDDVGIPERLFWSTSHPRVVQAIDPPGITATKGILARIQQCIESDNVKDSNRDTQLLLASLLSNTRFAEEMLQLKSDGAAFASSIWPLLQWLIRKAILGPNDHVTDNAIHATSIIFEQYVDECAALTVDVIRSCLIQLGGEEEVLKVSGALGESASSLVPQMANAETERRFSRTSRMRRTAKAIDVCNHLIHSLTNAGREAVLSSEPLFFWLLALAGDPESEYLRLRLKDLSQSHIDTIFKHSNALESDVRLCDELFTKLKHQSNTSRLVALDALPKHSLRSRVLIRNIAVRLFTLDPSKEDAADEFTYTVFATDLPALLAVLSKQQPGLNPLSISRLADPDYVQMNAAVALLQFCLTDLMIQLSSTHKHRHKPSKAQETTYEQYIEAGLDRLIRHDPKWIARTKLTETDTTQATTSEPIRLSPDWSKARELCKIQEQLDRLNARVVADGGGGGVYSSALRASEGQARLKDALQRASFMIRFFLDQFSMSKDRITSDRQQSLEYFATKK